MKQNFSSSDKIKITLVIIFIAAFLFLFGILLGVMLRQSGFRLSTLFSQAQATLNSTFTPSIPTILVPTQDCSPPTLTLGATTFEIENVTRAADGSLNLPPGTSGRAYWVEGTNTNYVFVLPPLPENLAVMSTLTDGTATAVTWSNCDSTTYSLSAPQQSSLNVSTASDQSMQGITVFIETDPSGTGFAFTGALTGQEITTFNTPSPNEVQAEIGLLEMVTSTDRKTVTVVVSIQNYGASAITVTANVIALTQPNGAALVLESSRPRLPEGIRPGDTKSFDLTFPRPTSPTATLKIFTVEYDIEGY
jgi:hypothetical protein